MVAINCDLYQRRLVSRHFSLGNGGEYVIDGDDSLNSQLVPFSRNIYFHNDLNIDCFYDKKSDDAVLGKIMLLILEDCLHGGQKDVARSCCGRVGYFKIN